MKQRIAVILLTFIVHFGGVCQENISITYIDSIYQPALSEVFKRDPDSVLATAENIEILSKELSYDWGLVQSNLLRGLVSYRINNLDSAALFLLQTALAAEDQQDDSNEEGRARLALGLIYQRLTNYEKAAIEFDKAVRIFESNGNTLRFLMTLNNVGTNQGYLGNNNEALKVFLDARTLIQNSDLAEETKNSRMARNLANISIIYSIMEEDELAIQYGKEAIEMAEKQEDIPSLSHLYGALAESFISADQLDSAIHYSREGLQLAIDYDYGDEIFLNIQRIASLYAKQGKLDLAISELRRSLEKRGADRIMLEDAYKMLSEYYMTLERMDSALFYSRRAFEQAQLSKSKVTIRSTALNLSNYYERQSQFDSALKYRKLYHLYNDSIFNESNTRKFTNLRVDLETSEKQKEIEILRKDQLIRASQNRTTILGFSIILLLGIVGFSLFRIKQKKKQRDLENQLEVNRQKLSGQTLNMIYKNNGFAEIEAEINEMKKAQKPNYQRILNIISINKSVDKDWENFNNYFNQVHPKFNDVLLNKFPGLASGDRRLAVLVKMNLTNREMASILFIEPKSIRMAKYRLKKKLGLSESDDLQKFLNGLS